MLSNENTQFTSPLNQSLRGDGCSWGTCAIMKEDGDTAPINNGDGGSGYGWGTCTVM